jgi:Synergist-CTERM protein sorting domain-containing protein
VNFTVTILGDDGNPISADKVDVASNARLSSDFGLRAEIVDGRVVIRGTATNAGIVKILVILVNNETRTIMFRIDPSRFNGDYITNVTVSKVNPGGEAPRGGDSGGGGCDAGFGAWALFPVLFVARKMRRKYR